MLREKRSRDKAKEFFGKAKESVFTLYQKAKQKIEQLQSNQIHHVVGLEINSDTIKLLQINSGDDARYDVESFVIGKVPAGAFQRNEIKNINELAQTLKEIYKQSNIKSKNIAIAIPKSSTIIKSISVDSRLTLDEIESKVWIEANRLFPNLIDDIYLDFITEGAPNPETNQVEVTVVACRKGQINPYLDVIKMAGLIPRVVDINSYALERAFAIIAQQYPDLPTIALLNIGISQITLIVRHEGNLIFTHEQSYEAQRLMSAKNKQVVKEKELATESAGGMNELNLSEFSQESQVGDPSLNLNLRYMMQFFYSNKPNITIQKIFLSGDCATIPNLTQLIQNEIGIETILPNPFKNMLILSNIDHELLLKYEPSLMLCCGLALSAIK